MQASTPSRCLRSESLCTHSVTSSQASSRVGSGKRDGRLSRVRSEPEGKVSFGTLAPPRTMEKFVIEGGYPLSGTVDPAGNKNAALPVLAATLLTEEEVVLRNVPRIRDVEAMAELLSRLGVSVEWREDNVRRPAGRPGHRHRGRPRALRAHPRLVPAGRAAAGPLRPLRDAAARRRRDRPPAARSPPGRLPRAGRRHLLQRPLPAGGALGRPARV